MATRAVIAAFDAVADGGRVTVVWETASEVKTLGFYLERLDPGTGRFDRISPRLVPGLFNASRGGIYQHVDSGAEPGQAYTYRLIEVEAPGREIVLGPYAVTADENPNFDGLPDFDGDFYRIAHVPETVAVARPRMMAMAFAPLAVEVETGDVLKVAVSRDGLVFVSSASMAEKFGISAEAVSDRIAQGQLSVTLAGESVGYMAAFAGLYFYGQAPDSIYTSENIYLVTEGSGLRLSLSPRKGDVDGDDRAGLSDAVGALQIMTGVTPSSLPQGHPVAGADVDGDGRIGLAEVLYGLQSEAGLRGGEVGVRAISGFEAAAAGYFSHTAHFEQDLYPLTDYATDPSGDYWSWATLLAGDAASDTLTHAFTTHNVVTGGGTARIVVHLQSLSDTAVAQDHHVQVSLNGEVIAEGRWDGDDFFDLGVDFAASLLRAGDQANTLTVQALLDTGASYSDVSMDSFDLTYPRWFKAVDDQLVFTAGENAEVVVTGFSGSSIYVFNVTDPARPVQVTGTDISGDSGEYQVRFEPVSDQAQYVALLLDQAQAPGAVTVDTPSTLSDAANEGQYLIITPETFAEAVQDLADYRAGQGMSVRIALLEDIMDEFNHGIFSPEAIRTFLVHANGAWAVPPRYVVLVGEGSYDYRDIVGTAYGLAGQNFMPPVMVATPEGLFGSDNRLADLTGDDDVPEMAIGRLPVATADELAMLIDKIRDYESQAPADWQKRIIMAADNPEGAGADFGADSDAAATFIPSGYTTDKVYLGVNADLPQSWAALYGPGGINAGALLLNYIGHGGYFNMTADGLMVESDDFGLHHVTELDNVDKLPVISAFSCVLGRFDYPAGFDGLSEKLLMQSRRGAVAVFSSSGWSINAKARYLNEEFFRALFVDGKTRLGDAVVQALGRYRQRTGDTLVPRTYNLLGDPALKVHLDDGPS